MVRYICDENIGVRTIAKVKDEILMLFEKNEDLTLDMGAVRRIDLSVGQLVISVQKEGKKRGVSVRLAGISPELKTQLSLCGVIRWGGNL
ncbi:MAG TPA: STAS domain-containing protein [Spirochaetota bacterium]